MSLSAASDDDYENEFLSDLCIQMIQEKLEAFIEDLRYGDILNSPTKLEFPVDTLVDTSVENTNDDWKDVLRYEGYVVIYDVIVM